MKYLFLFTIPSVQQFISQARKTHDLWAGSQIFNELMIVAAKKFIESGGELIFPAYSKQDLEADAEKITFTNRFLGYWENIGEKPVQDFAIQIAEKTKNYWLDKALHKIWDVLKDKTNEFDEFEKSITEQLQTALDIKWAAIKFDDNNYKEKYLELEQLLGAVKDIRLPNGFTEVGRKCSVDGIRNVKFYRKKDEKDNPFWLKFTPDVILFETNNLDLRYIAPGEGLSAVSFARRLWEPNYEFSSTAEIATLDGFNKAFKLNDIVFKDNDSYQLKRILTSKAIENNLNKLANRLASVKNDTKDKIKTEFNFQWFLDSYRDLEDEDLKLEIIKFKKEYSLKFNDYYALVMFDGDNMGKHLSNIAISVDEHRKFSRKLSNFSKKIKEEIKYPNGKTIYSGGDDYLGFSTLENLFENIRRIKEIFKDETKDYNLSGSFGIVIADYKTPLNQVVTYAREVLEEAKDRYKDKINDLDTEKDAIGFVVFAGNKVVSKAFMKNRDIEDIKLTVEKIADKNLSAKFIFNIMREFELILQQDFSYKGFLQTKVGIKTEINRLVQRASTSDFKKNKKDNFKKIVSKLRSIIDKNIIELGPDNYAFDYQNILGIFKLIEQLSKHLSKYEKDN